MTRAEAKKQGLRYFDPGRLCPKGHTALYTTARGGCVECQKLANSRPENKARRAAYAQTPQGQSTLNRAKQTYRESDHGKATERAYKAEYRPRENELARQRYADRGGYHDLRYGKVRRKRLDHIHPDDREAVRKIYEVARLLGMEVDHIIPLEGTDVCGLHTLCNLQLLTPSEHRVKTAREAKALRMFKL